MLKHPQRTPIKSVQKHIGRSLISIFGTTDSQGKSFINGTADDSYNKS